MQGKRKTSMQAAKLPPAPWNACEGKESRYPWEISTTVFFEARRRACNIISRLPWLMRNVFGFCIEEREGVPSVRFANELVTMSSRPFEVEREKTISEPFM